jgi:glycosyltransferase involved in cell wall biosynthesis
MPQLEHLNLVLFFTRGVSLKTWDQTGTFEREVMLYRCLQDQGARIGFVTYGLASDLAYADRLPGIQILCNRWGLPHRLYARLIPWLHWPALKQAIIFKTNQTEGAEIALKAKRIFGKRMITRAGFMWSIYLSQLKTTDQRPANSQAILQRERVAFSQADKAVVTTDLMKNYIVENYGLPRDKVNIIPNFVLTDTFAPSFRETYPAKPCIIFLGRLSPEKNLLGLLEALSGLNVQLMLIGEGPQRQQLEEKAGSYNLEVCFLGQRSHYELPGLLNQADLFILPSIWEGHPKALLEAMACALPVIGTAVPGIQELIRHGETGYLCGTSPDEMRAAIQQVLSDGELRERMGRQARQFIVGNFSLERIIELEVNLLSSLARHN